jgi:origin recognition complex subunit 1
LNSIPDYFPCRDVEIEKIENYIKNGLSDGSTTSLYISGMPGTGKTATTLEVVRRMQESFSRSKAKKSKIKPFKFIHINGMQLSNPNLVYSIIYEDITKQKATPAEAANFLDGYFSSKTKKSYVSKNTKKGKNNRKGEEEADIPRVILIDELDALITHSQDLLYNIFDWPSY